MSRLYYSTDFVTCCVAILNALGSSCLGINGSQFNYNVIIFIMILGYFYQCVDLLHLQKVDIQNTKNTFPHFVYDVPTKTD